MVPIPEVNGVYTGHSNYVCFLSRNQIWNQKLGIISNVNSGKGVLKLKCGINSSCFLWDYNMRAVFIHRVNFSSLLEMP